jgi:hypothetical protein
MASRRWLIPVLISILGLYITILAFQPSIDYWVEQPTSLERGLNSINMYFKNGGSQWDGDFILALTFVNATVSTQIEQPYTKVNDSTVKFKFVLHKGESYNKKVFFTTNDNVQSLTVKLALEKVTSLIS